MEIPKPVGIAIIVVVVVLALAVGFWYLGRPSSGAPPDVNTQAAPPPPPGMGELPVVGGSTGGAAPTAQPQAPSTSGQPF